MSTEKGQQERRIKSFAANVMTSSSFFLVNKQLVMKIGYRDAMTLGLLIDAWQYWSSVGKLEDDGSFYKVRQEIADDMGTGLRDIDSAIKNLQACGLIEVKRKGLPAKCFYKINFEKIHDILHDDPISKEQVKTGEQDLLLEQNCNSSGSSHRSAFGADLDLLEKQTTNTTGNKTTKTRLQEIGGADHSPSAAQLGPTERRQSGGSDVWVEYADRFERTHGFSPPRSAKANKQCLDIVKAIGKERAIAAMRAWFSKEYRRVDSYPFAQSHPLELFQKQINKILKFAETGELQNNESVRRQAQTAATMSAAEQAIANLNAREARNAER